MLNFLPEKITIFEIELHSYNTILNKEEFVQKLNKYRNFFRQSFGDSSETDLESTRNYLKQIETNPENRLLYGIFIDEELIGQYGLRAFDQKYVLLDNSLRFEASGPSDLFRIISINLINELHKIDKEIKIFTAIKSKNVYANRLHEYGIYSEISQNVRERLGFSKELILREFKGFIN